MTTEVREVNGLLMAGDTSFQVYEWYELPPRIPEEDIIASRGACARSQFHGFTDMSTQNQKGRAEALRICAECSVQDECRTVVDYLEANVPNARWFTGIWAGEGRADRERRRKEAAKAA